MKDFIDIFNQVAELAPPILLALVINFILLYLRKFIKDPDWLPLIAMAIGGIIYPFIAEAGKVSYNVSNPLIYLVIFGLAIGGLSVAFHKTFRAILSKFGSTNGDTKINEKTSTTPPTAP